MTLTPEAEAYLSRLVAWAENYEVEKAKRLGAYWTPERREEASAKARDYWTPERRRIAALQAPQPAKRDLPRVNPSLPDSTPIWRSSKSGSCYHLSASCPAIPAHGKLNRGRLGGMRAAGRVLCYYESFHWKRGGA